MISAAPVPRIAKEAQDGPGVPLGHRKRDGRPRTKFDAIPAPVKEFGLKPHDVVGSPRGDVLEAFRKGCGRQNRQGAAGGILRHPVYVDEDPKRISTIHGRVDGHPLATSQLDAIAPSLGRLGKKEALLSERKSHGGCVSQGSHRGTGPLCAQSGLCELYRTQGLHVGFVRRQVAKFVGDLIDLIARTERKNREAGPSRPSRERGAHVP